MALLPLCGCLGLGVQFRDEQGRALDWPRGDNPVIVEMFFIQSYNEPVYISVNGGSRTELKPGRNRLTSLTSEKSIPFEVWWGKRVGYDTILEGKHHHVVGLYTGQPIVIDELFLLGLVRVEFVVANISGESLDFVDGHGSVFTLKPGEDRILNILAGNYILTWRPSDKSYTGPSIKGRRVVRLGQHIFWKGVLYDAGTLIDRGRPTWAEDSLFRNGGYIPI
jgi:hypothetical protein